MPVDASVVIDGQRRGVAQHRVLEPCGGRVGRDVRGDHRTRDQSLGVAPAVARHALLRSEDALLVHALLDGGAHEHAGKEDVVGVGEDHAQEDRARGGIHRDL